ncbi:MAG: phosphatase PAP2 family protein [Gammaproteobacteria bacterium]|nr:phosphatase PAP2 family protein [Gammaproteobacteria bacterium]
MGRLTVTVLAFAFLSGTNPNAVSAGDEELEKAGDILQLLLPVAGFAATYIDRDPVGRIQFLKAAVTTGVSVGGIKFAVSKQRPDQSADNSFPSGHTAAAFMGAGFIQTRYGPTFGVPALALGVLTGYSRVNADRHFADDVVAGMSFGLMSNWLWVTRRKYDDVAFTPTYEGGRMGVNLDLFKLSASTPAPAGWKPKWRYEFEFGAAFRDKNEMTAPRGSGQTLDFAQFDDTQDPTETAHVQISRFWGAENENDVALKFWPFEVRDFATPKQDTTWNNTVFAAGVQGSAQYRMYETRLRYRRHLVNKQHFDFMLGVALSYQDLTMRVTNADGADTRVDDHVFIPLIHLHIGFKIDKRWKIYGDFDAIKLSDDEQYEGSLMLQYQANKNWDIGIGARYFDRITDTDSFTQDFQLTRAIIRLGYSW